MRNLNLYRRQLRTLLRALRHAETVMGRMHQGIQPREVANWYGENYSLADRRTTVSYKYENLLLRYYNLTGNRYR